MILLAVMWALVGAFIIFVSGMMAGNAMRADEFSHRHLVVVSLGGVAFGIAALGFAIFTASPL